MPTAITCKYKNVIISITKAIQIRSSSKIVKGAFTCVECGEAVRVHKDGGHVAAHFEHYLRNPLCSLSHPNSSSNYQPPKSYDIESPQAIEGYRLDRNILSLKRNAGIAEKCKKRDDYTCLACGFRLEINGQFIAECHHLFPVSSGERTVSLDELVTLCPTCHRIAHTRIDPYKIDELKSFHNMT